MQRQGKTQGLPVCLHKNWCEAQLCLNKDLLAEALISYNKSYWSTTMNVQCVQKVTARSFRQNIPGLSELFGEPIAPTTQHKQTCPTISSSFLWTMCSILFWSDYSYISMHRPSHMAGRGTASHIVGKKLWGQETAGNLLSTVIPSTTPTHIPLIPTAEQDHTSELI